MQRCEKIVVDDDDVCNRKVGPRTKVIEHAVFEYFEIPSE